MLDYKLGDIVVYNSEFLICSFEGDAGSSNDLLRGWRIAEDIKGWYEEYNIYMFRGGRCFCKTYDLSFLPYKISSLTPFGFVNEIFDKERYAEDRSREWAKMSADLTDQLNVNEYQGMFFINNENRESDKRVVYKYPIHYLADRIFSLEDKERDWIKKNYKYWLKERQLVFDLDGITSSRFLWGGIFKEWGVSDVDEKSAEAIVDIMPYFAKEVKGEILSYEESVWLLTTIKNIYKNVSSADKEFAIKMFSIVLEEEIEINKKAAAKFANIIMELTSHVERIKLLAISTTGKQNNRAMPLAL